jgi:hypothetical protein
MLSNLKFLKLNISESILIKVRLKFVSKFSSIPSIYIVKQFTNRDLFKKVNLKIRVKFLHNKNLNSR